ncbi:probable WRKY transcription factor 70 [Phalaenopsis equestris]|uniref:probable WRKY transcription factor 70 n=1 Tax=Phalaenopsis equestris TaxID=78828 RepID=UPI0009E34257|nr:probable WRKY transcription factor 70 [Phalaenopsis equestris]
MGSQEEEILSPPSWKDSAMKELAQGRDSLVKLASLLQIGSSENNRPENATATAGILIEEAISAIYRAMSAVESAGEKMEVNLAVDSSSATSKDVGGKRKTQTSRKAGYRRRSSPYLWRRITSNKIDDGHTWRKYGQKDIFSAKYPRSYFRCTHKFDQGCKASKQVQRSEDDDSLFVITYFGDHTCVDPSKAMIPPSRELCVISFESSNGENVEKGTPFSFPSLNQEGEEEVISNLTSADSASDYFVSPENELEQSALEQNGLPAALYSSFMSYGTDFMDDENFLNFDHTDMF